MGLGKRLARGGLVRLSSLLTLTSLKRLARREVYIVNYHSILDADSDPFINRNVYRSISEFEQDVRFCSSRFNIISAVDLIELIRESKPFPKDAMVITFDDGLRINYDLQVPVLRKYNVTATFFLCSSFIDNQELHYGRKINLLIQALLERDERQVQNVRDYLSDNNLLAGDVGESLATIGYHHRQHLSEIAKLIDVDFQSYLAAKKPYLGSGEIAQMLSEGFTVGGHSIDHPRFGDLSLEEQVRQTVHSVRYLKEKFGISYGLFAFPYNDDSLSQEYYTKIRPDVDLTFGMGGFVDDPVEFNLQRAEVESTKLPIELALKYRLLLSIGERVVR